MLIKSPAESPACGRPTGVCDSDSQKDCDLLESPPGFEVRTRETNKDDSLTHLERIFTDLGGTKDFSDSGVWLREGKGFTAPLSPGP